MSIKDYSSASAYLGKKTDRPLPGRASRIIRRSADTIAIRYQQTDVVTYHSDNTITLQSGGWQSVTTKARFTDYTLARVYSVKGQWFVRVGDSWDNPPALFEDGMRIDANGSPIEPTYPTTSDAQKKRALDKQISAYIKGFAAHITADGINDPSNGDCFGCLFQVVNAPEVTQGAFRLQGKPTPHGRVEPMGLSHYVDHMRENYFVPSLLFNAIKAAGYRDPAFIWCLIRDGKNGDMAARILRGSFKNMKPALYASL